MKVVNTMSIIECSGDTAVLVTVVQRGQQTPAAVVAWGASWAVRGQFCCRGGL